MLLLWFIVRTFFFFRKRTEKSKRAPPMPWLVAVRLLHALIFTEEMLLLRFILWSFFLFYFTSEPKQAKGRIRPESNQQYRGTHWLANWFVGISYRISTPINVIISWRSMHYMCAVNIHRSAATAVIYRTRKKKSRGATPTKDSNCHYIVTLNWIYRDQHANINHWRCMRMHAYYFWTRKQMLQKKKKNAREQGPTISADRQYRRAGRLGISTPMPSIGAVLLQFIWKEIEEQNYGGEKNMQEK